jgi:hypothetical protein
LKNNSFNSKSPTSFWIVDAAKKLLQCEQKKGIALADAHITDCHNIKAYQVEPTPIIQLDQCRDYAIQNPNFFLSARSASSFGVYLDNSASSSKINAGSLL